ncbi:uncharacterized protein EV154DRAFT_604743 [Mucor mucedo]|uniref:uncharacterized protein n=1 Tax=Mucor mucedo TaxID=29922 RepID=UPI00221E5FFC|nr:uncharacterized protein EV154DRAFT_604743 [Mucor mucedo]KAI7888556.1 hypothetical protein EV154DRAFT_604743 [Mucor mucedo]
MSNWSQLPAELLIEIIELCYLDRLELQSGVSQQLLVCKNWYRIAQTLLYRDVTLLSIKQHDTFLTCMSRYSTGMNQLVHLFVAPSEITSVKLEEDLGLILNILPNLQHFHAKPQKGSFFARLLLELYSSSNRPTQLLEIPEFSVESEQDARTYQYAVWALKKTLKSMILPDWCIQPYRITTPLEDFKNLSHLKLRVSGLSQMSEIATIVSRCPNLTSLNIARNTGYNPFGEDQMKVIDTTHVQPVSHLVKLVIDTSVATASPYIMRLLMKLFPQLESWLMYTDRKTTPNHQYHDLSRMIPTEVWVQFLTYMDNINLFYGTGLVISSFDQVLREISSSTGFCKEIKVNYNKANPQSDNEGFPILDIHPKIVRDMDYYLYDIHETSVSYTPRERRIHLPHESLIEQIGFQLEHLTIDLNMVFSRPVAPNHMAGYGKKRFGYFINHIFMHCPVLEALVITGADLVFCDDGDKEGPPSLKFLHFQFCNIIHRWNFLSKLSRRLPSRLEWMAIDECGFPKRSDELAPHVEMPFTVFGCLFLSRKKLPVKKYSRMVIKITKVSQKPLYYCLYDQHKLESLSGQEEFEVCLKDKETYAMQITCSDIEKLLIRAFGFRILIFPKEKVEYMDGQNYINSSPVFQHVLK